MGTPAPVLKPGDRVGILGSGQLGRMLAIAAARLGLKCHIFAPEDGPAMEVAAFSTVAPYEDEAALEEFANTVEVVTYEFENVPAATAAFLGSRKPVLPGPGALAATQDRLSEKDFLNSIAIATAPYMAVDDAGSLARAVAHLGRPSILKTRRLGYDGKGQTQIREGSDLAAIFRSLHSVPCILEGMVPFVREVSVVGARNRDGAFRAFDVCENEHENHILARTTVPARLAPDSAQAAIAMAQKIADALEYVGVIAVEMFLVDEPVYEDGKVSGTREKLVVNEIAPRVHNSGHWTIDGAITCQFEQHIRAIAGWPLGDTSRHGGPDGRVEMENLIGADAGNWKDILERPGDKLHLYGKAEARPGRKMGHVTRVIAGQTS